MRESGHNLWEIQPLDAAGPRGSSRPCGVLFHSLTLMAATYAFCSHSHMYKLILQHTLWFCYMCVLFYVLNVLQKLITFPPLHFSCYFFPSLNLLFCLFPLSQLCTRGHKCMIVFLLIALRTTTFCFGCSFFISFFLFFLKKKEKDKQKIETTGRD